jgi:hypothetical protein
MIAMRKMTDVALAEIMGPRISRLSLDVAAPEAIDTSMAA